MSAQKQMNIQSGSVFDDEVAATDLLFRKNRVPAVGERVEMRDGRGYVFCSTDQTFVAGELVAVATCLATEFANLIVVSGNYPGAINATELEINSSGTAFFGGGAGVIAAGRLAGGTIHMTDESGEGYTYGIKNNTVGTAAIDIILTLEHGLKVAVDATTDCHIVGQKFRHVIEGTNLLSTVGAAVVPTSAAADSEEQFFWVQYKGPATVLCTAGCTIGLPATPAAAGEIIDNDAGVDQVIGTFLGTSGNGYAVVDLDINL